MQSISFVHAICQVPLEDHIATSGSRSDFYDFPCGIECFWSNGTYLLRYSLSEKIRLFFLSLLYYIAFADYITWFSVDRPFLPTDLFDSAEFVMYYPEFIFQAGSRQLFKYVILALAPLVIKIAHIIYQRTAARQTLNRSTTRILFAYVFLSIFFSPILIHQGYYKNNTLVRIASEVRYEHRLKNLTLNIDKAKFFGHVPQHIPHNPSAWKGSQSLLQKPNLIFFVLETAPDRFYPDLSNYLKMIGRSDIDKRTFRFSEHYSTYPQSDRAIYSILSGKYPPLDKGDEWIDAPDIYEYALPKILKKNGYTSYLLSTAPLDFHNNLAMFKGLGFDYLEEMEKTKDARQTKDGVMDWNRPLLYAADEELLDKTLALIDSRAQSPSEPYLLMLTPQASHAPFQKPPGFVMETPDDVDLLQANAHWQFNLLVHIIDRLIARGLLEKSLVIVTGDHGIRNRYESRQLLKSQHILDAACYHVPLWVIDGIEAKPFAYPSFASSHIDITPSLLDWLDITFDSGVYHGRSIFTVTRRPLFFLGGNILPVSGYKEEDCFYMENRYLNLYRTSSKFYFYDVPIEISSNLKYPSDNCHTQTNLENKISRKMRQIKYILYTMTALE